MQTVIPGRAESADPESSGTDGAYRWIPDRRHSASKTRVKRAYGGVRNDEKC
jgi:hypothetical protein